MKNYKKFDDKDLVIQELRQRIKELEADKNKWMKIALDGVAIHERASLELALGKKL